MQKIWAAHGLKPHLIRRFKLSTDQRFAEKLRDVVGLYIDPPERALVLSVDEKSQIQALDRTQPGLPMKKGRAGTMTHLCTAPVRQAIGIDSAEKSVAAIYPALNCSSLELRALMRSADRHPITTTDI